MKKIICVFFLTVFLTSSVVSAKGDPSLTSNYHKLKLESTTLNKIKQKASFNLLIPGIMLNEWTVELKYPYPLDTTKPIQSVRLHYFDKDENYILGIEEHISVGYKINRVVTSIDIRNETSTTRTIVEDFKFNERGEKININGMEGRFEPWANHIPGGYLRWIQNGTFIEIDSGDLTKEEMVRLAGSMI